MNLGEIKNQVMFQTNNDSEDVGDFMPALTDYINEAYDRAVKVWTKHHVPLGEYERLAYDSDEPLLPEWTHRYLADWATWLVYRNGNPQKQQRGYAFRESFLWLLSTMADEGGAAGLNEDGSQKTYNKFINIPR